MYIIVIPEFLSNYIKINYILRPAEIKLVNLPFFGPRQISIGQFGPLSILSCAGLFRSAWCIFVPFITT